MPSNSNNKASFDLTADPSQLNESLKQSESLITRYGKKIQSIMENVGKVISYSLGLAARSTANAVAGFKNLFLTLVDLAKSVGVLNTQVSSLNSVFQNGIIALSEYTSNLFKSWQIQTDLSLAIKMTGKSAGFTSEQMDRYADYLEKVTKYSKDANIGTQQILAHFRDIRGKNFLEATKAAQNMATALRIDLAQAAAEVGNALQNPIEAMAQLEQRNIFFTRKEQETILKLLETNKVIEAQSIVLKKLNDSFGGAAQKEISSFGAKIEQVKNRLYGVAKAIAEHVIRRLNKLIGVTEDGTSRLEAYISKIESFVPIIAQLIDTAIQKMQEWADVIQSKLIVAFTYFTKIAVTGVAIIQTAFQNLSKIVRFVTANFELQLEKMKQTWLSIWTRVVPASLRYVERLFKEITEVKIPNFFTRMIQKILTIMTKGLISGVIGLLNFASGKWAITLGSRGALIGTRLMLRFMKAAIETPLKMGGIYAKVFNTIFGLAGLSVEKIGENIGRKLAEAEAQAAKEKGQISKNNYGADTIENFFKKLLPERAARNDLTAPDFAAMFDRNETELEKALNKEISELKESISKDFGENKEINKTKAEELKKKVQQLLAEQEKANKEFQDKFGKKALEPNMAANDRSEFDREEARAAKKRAEEEAKKRKEEEIESKKQQQADEVAGLEEFWYKQTSEIDKNTKAVKENTAELRISKLTKEEKDKIQKDQEDALKNRGKAGPGFNAFIFNLPKNQRKLELDRKKQEREDKQFAERIESRRRNDKFLRDRKAKPTLKEQNQFGINSEQQKKQQQTIMNAQIRRSKERDENQKKMKAYFDDLHAKQANSAAQSRIDAKHRRDRTKDEQLSFDKLLKELIGESKGTNKNTKQAADNLDKIGSV